MENTYEVVVDNVGVVYRGKSKQRADKDFLYYRNRGDHVCKFKNDELDDEANALPEQL